MAVGLVAILFLLPRVKREEIASNAFCKVIINDYFKLKSLSRETRGAGRFLHFGYRVDLPAV
jgi:hypothetical protein